MRTIEEIKEVFKTHLDIDENSVFVDYNTFEDWDTFNFIDKTQEVAEKNLESVIRLLAEYADLNKIPPNNLMNNINSTIKQNDFNLNTKVLNNKKMTLNDLISFFGFDIYNLSELDTYDKDKLEQLDSICDAIIDWDFQRPVSPHDYER